jgi:RHS repeat-associated protein
VIGGWFVRSLVIVLSVLLPQIPLAAQPSPDPSPGPASEPQLPPPPPKSREPVQAPIEPEENAEPIDLPDLAEVTEPAELLAGAELRPVSPTETLLSFPNDPSGLAGSSHLALVTSGPSNYQAADGAWKKIDPKLRKELGGWKNTAGPFQLFLPESLTPATPVTFTLPEGTLAFSPETADPTVKGKDREAGVTYHKVLPDTDLVYSSIEEGLKEEIVLFKDKASPDVSFVVAATGLSLDMDPSGGLAVLADQTEVAQIPAPTVADAAGYPGEASYLLQPLGGSTWRLTVSVDAGWFEHPTRVFPVTIDPFVSITSSEDSWVDLANWYARYGDSTLMRVENIYSGSTGGESLVKFDMTSLAASASQILDARMWAWAENSANNTPLPVDVVDVTSWWTEDQVRYWDKPGSGSVQATASGTSYNAPNSQPWYQWDISNLVNEWTSGARPNHGVYLRESSNYFRDFATSEHAAVNGTDVRPVLVVEYNSPPNAPVRLEPPPEEVVESESPHLSIQKPVTDPDGDRVYMRYQVATDSNFNNMVTQSGWLERQYHWVVPTGSLKDGQAYWWRGQTSDLIKGKNNRPPRERTSDHGRFTTAFAKWGTDPRWGMWPHDLGNGVSLEVNQANGNLFLDYPLDSLATPAGPLDLSLAYNSLQHKDFDFASGWTVSAGAGNDPGPRPVRLSIPSWGGVKIRFSDGSRRFFPKVEGNLYGSIGGGAGTLWRSDDAPRWRLNTASGSRYAFNADGELITARTSTGDWANPGFTYGYSGGRMIWIRDALNREVTLIWNGDGTLDRIITWAAGVWDFDYGSGLLTSVTAPGGETVSFTYVQNADASGGGPIPGGPVWDVGGVIDGEGATTAITYETVTGLRPKVARVTPAGLSTGYTFTYTGPFTGQFAARTDLTDPRGPGTPDLEDFTTKTWFNTAGLPIRVDGPRDDNGVWGTTTQLWDTNSNLVCRRSPQANALTLGCDHPESPATDSLQTDWTYQFRVPHLVTSETGPQNDQGHRAVTTYGYDEGFQELYAEYFPNTNLAGEPAGAGFEQSLNLNWGNGAPAPLNPTQNWSMRLTGRLEITTGRTFFRVLSDQGNGIRMTVGSKLVFDCWSNAQACADEDFQFESGEKRFVLEFREFPLVGGGTARMHLRWHKASESQFEDVPTSSLAPEVNLLTSVTDPVGTTSFTYTGGDKARRRVTSETRGARTVSSSYDQYGRVTQMTDPLAHTITNTFTDACLTKVVDRTGAETRYQCNAAGDVTEQTRVIRAVALQPAQERITKTTYDPLGSVDTVSERIGGVFEQTLDNEYDDAGRLTSSTDALGAETVFAYNPRGLLNSETLPDPDGTGSEVSPVSTHGYDAAGNRTSTTDARGHIWRTTFDALGRPRLAKDPLCEIHGLADPRCSVTETSYDLPLNQTSLTDPAGVETTTSFDLLGQRVSEQLGTLPSATFEYDTAGRLVEETDPAAVATQRGYNAFGELTSETKPTGPGGTLKTTTWAYDTGGRMTSMTDPLGNVTGYDFDNEGRLIEVDLPTSPAAITAYTLDDVGELVRIDDGAGNVRRATFDERGRRITTSDARGTTIYVYDRASRMMRIELPNDVTQYFGHDLLGRRTRRYGGSPSDPVDDESYAYDPAGNMVGASRTDGSRLVEMAYDPAGRIETVTAQGATSTYAHEDGRLVSRADASGTSSFTYNANGQLQTLTDPFGSVVSYGYYPDGRKHTRAVAVAGLSSTWTYDPAGRMDTLTTTQGGQAVASADLGYDALGNVTSKTQAIEGLPASEQGTWTYHYDGASRLIQATEPDGTPTVYDYDGAGNRTSVKVGSDPAVVTTFDGAGHPDFASDGTDYETDASGSLLKISRPAAVADTVGTTRYTYDTWGRLTQAQRIPLPGLPPALPALVSYAYDPLDRMTTRTEVVILSTTYRYAGETQDVVKETLLDEAPLALPTTTLYSHAPEGPLASKGNLGTRWYVGDTHGDVVAEVDSADPIGARSYSPSGEEREATTIAPGPFGFQGDWTDSATELVDMGARLYSGGLGRFTTMDPLEGSIQNPTSLNDFIYGWGNPVTLSDPYGLEPGISGRGDETYCYPSCYEQDHERSCFVHGCKPQTRRIERQQAAAASSAGISDAGSESLMDELNERLSRPPARSHDPRRRSTDDAPSCFLPSGNGLELSCQVVLIPGAQAPFPFEPSSPQVRLGCLAQATGGVCVDTGLNLGKGEPQDPYPEYSDWRWYGAGAEPPFGGSGPRCGNVCKALRIALILLFAASETCQVAPCD